MTQYPDAEPDNRAAHKTEPPLEDDSRKQWIALLRGRQDIQLEGTFTASDLRKIIRWLEATQLNPHVGKPRNDSLAGKPEDF